MAFTPEPLNDTAQRIDALVAREFQDAQMGARELLLNHPFPIDFFFRLSPETKEYQQKAGLTRRQAFDYVRRAHDEIFKPVVDEALSVVGLAAVQAAMVALVNAPADKQPSRLNINNLSDLTRYATAIAVGGHIDDRVSHAKVAEEIGGHPIFSMKRKGLFVVLQKDTQLAAHALNILIADAVESLQWLGLLGVDAALGVRGKWEDEVRHAVRADKPARLFAPQKTPA